MVGGFSLVWRQRAQKDSNIQDSGSCWLVADDKWRGGLDVGSVCVHANLKEEPTNELTLGLANEVGVHQG